MKKWYNIWSYEVKKEYVWQKHAEHGSQKRKKERASTDFYLECLPMMDEKFWNAAEALVARSSPYNQKTMIARACKVGLRRNKDFFKTAVRLRSRGVLWHLGSDEQSPHCLCIVSKKTAPSAVDRNRLKRLVYEELQKAWGKLPRRSIVVVVHQQSLRSQDIYVAIQELCSFSHPRVSTGTTTAWYGVDLSLWCGTPVYTISILQCVYHPKNRGAWYNCGIVLRDEAHSFLPIIW